MAITQTKLPKKNPKVKRIIANLRNKKYEKQRLRTARNKRAQAEARMRKAKARANRAV